MVTCAGPVAPDGLRGARRWGGSGCGICYPPALPSSPGRARLAQKSSADGGWPTTLVMIRMDRPRDGPATGMAKKAGVIAAGAGAGGTGAGGRAHHTSWSGSTGPSFPHARSHRFGSADGSVKPNHDGIANGAIQSTGMATKAGVIAAAGRPAAAGRAHRPVMVRLDRTIVLPGVALPMVRSSRTMTGSRTMPFSPLARQSRPALSPRPAARSPIRTACPADRIGQRSHWDRPD